MRKFSFLGTCSECQILTSRKSTDRDSVKTIFFSDTSATQKRRGANSKLQLSYLTSTGSFFTRKIYNERIENELWFEKFHMLLKRKDNGIYMIFKN